jgi:predicted nucleotide-binding protein (sugar kinase/HSP70/actin superfamily)
MSDDERQDGPVTIQTDGGTGSVAPTADPRLNAAIDEYGLEGRTLYLPQMPYGGSYLLGAAIRSIGFDAAPVPDSDERTLELGGKVTSGDECYPQKITVGDFLRIIEDVGSDKVAFLMPTANGPCRFGQYMHLIRRTLDDLGYPQVPVITITSSDGYASIGKYSQDLVRTAWRAVVAQDILMKMLLKTRPYEVVRGSADAAYHECLADVGAAVEQRDVSHRQRLAATVKALTRCRERFHAVEAVYDPSRPLIGVVGEIFCRLNTFANADIIRLVEEQGGECWLADIGEWVWYVDDEQARRLADEGRTLSKENAVRKIKGTIQARDEHALLAPFEGEFVGYEEPHNVRDVLELSRPYLPYDGALGEMVLSTGKAIYMYEKGADGIIDISPFTCMNGIITEAIYPAVSRDHDDLPMRIFYFDGTQSDLERDVGIFLELARTYQRRKKRRRVYPDAFAAPVA